MEKKKEAEDEDEDEEQEEEEEEEEEEEKEEEKDKKKRTKRSATITRATLPKGWKVKTVPRQNKNHSGIQSSPIFFHYIFLFFI